MKKIYCLILLAVLITAGCQPKVQNKPVDMTAVKGEITILMDKYLNAFNTKDVNTITGLVADDGLFCGTDPSELMDKKALSDMMTQSLADTSAIYSYSVDKREIRVAADGSSAIVLEQFTMPGISPKIPTRLIYHVVKAGDKWMFDFISWSFIPKNEDIVKLNKALE
jgi:ketosteroid isomerase-like protein